MKSAACLLVRAVVRDEADIAKFDTWYESEHLPDAKKAFGAVRAWRCWSLLDPHVHHAYYEFASEADAMAIRDTPAIKALIQEFDDTWGNRVERTREILQVAGRLE